MKNKHFWHASHVLVATFLVCLIQATRFESEHEKFLGRRAPIIDEFIGCFHERVCNANEICFDDGLFGKCLDERKTELAEPESYSLTSPQISYILRKSSSLLTDPWTSLSTQCKIRSLIFAVQFELPDSIIKGFCGPFSEIQIKRSRNQIPLEEAEKDSSTLASLSSADDDHYPEESPNAEQLDIVSLPEFDFPESLSDDKNNQKSFSSKASSVLVKQFEEQNNSNKAAKTSIWINLVVPLKSQSQAKTLYESILESLNGNPKTSSYYLSPNGRTLNIELAKNSEIKSDKEVLKRLKRFADSVPEEFVQDFGIVAAKRDLSADLNGDLVIGNPKLAKGLIISASVIGGLVFVVLAISIPLCIRKRRSSGNGKRLDLANEYDDDKCLVDAQTKKPQSEANEVGDILGPLASDARQIVDEAKKSAKNLITGASGYFSNLSKTKEMPNDKSNKVMTKQSSNGSITSICSSQRTSSTSSWSGEPAKMDIDITTGHLILSYLEKHLKDRNRLDEDWRSICSYEAEDAVICEAATRKGNMGKNRPGASLPYEQSRVKLRNDGADYINASLIYDHEPRHPAYIITQSPMESTMRDFWQMIWEQHCVTIVSLDRRGTLLKADSHRIADDPTSPVKYWPDEGWELCKPFEIHLVSEHFWCETDYVVRSFYLKNTETNETRTVTQFHFLTWPLGKPTDVISTMLEFRRRVNKSFRGKSSPIVIHCPDGSGACGTYLLLDLVLNRIQRGIKELDIAASLEHLRDQRQGIVQTKDQFEFVLSAIAEEVNALLKASQATSN